MAAWQPIFRRMECSKVPNRQIRICRQQGHCFFHLRGDCHGTARRRPIRNNQSDFNLLRGFAGGLPAGPSLNLKKYLP